MTADPPLRVLLAEDDESMRSYLCHYLHRQGMRVDAAFDGNEALRMVRQQPYDILLMDQRMPGLSGLEVLGHIRKEGLRLPVIILSGNGSEELAVQSLQSGATDYVTKIPDARFGEILLAKLHRAIERFAQQEEQRLGLEMLRQRMTELGCLYALEKLFESSEGSPRVALTAAANIIRPDCASQGAACCTVIRIGNDAYASDGAFESRTMETFDIRERDKIIGTLEVRLANGRPRSPEGLLTEVERELMMAVADRIGHFMDFWHTEQRLRESNAALEEYAYVASHDLQAPLQKIQSFAQILVEDFGPRLDDMGRQYLSIILKSAQQMRRLIRDVLSLARLDSDGLAFRDLDLNMLLPQVRDALSARIVERNAVLQLNPLPTIMADETRFFQLFQNLLSNALKFNDKPEPRIEIGQIDDAERWTLYVRDNGIGMSREDAARLFIPFKRLHSSEQYEGTGIGLALCRKIVRQHGGSIEVESEPGKGCTFWIRLPRAPEGTVARSAAYAEAFNSGGSHVEHHRASVEHPAGRG